MIAKEAINNQKVNERKKSEFLRTLCTRGSRGLRIPWKRCTEDLNRVFLSLLGLLDSTSTTSNRIPVAFVLEIGIEKCES